MQKTEVEKFCPSHRREWRQWLEENHKLKKSVWLVYYKQKANLPTLSWSEAVDEALCFGWIDSTAKSVDDEKYIQFFCPRKPTSVWSKINKAKVDRLIEQQLMTKAGYESIDIAKQNGSWTVLDDVEELKIPGDLELAFEVRPGSKDFFLSLSKSVRKGILQWVVLAKKPETRRVRIVNIAELAVKKLTPEQFRKRPGYG